MRRADLCLCRTLDGAGAGEPNHCPIVDCLQIVCAFWGHAAVSNCSAEAEDRPIMAGLLVGLAGTTTDRQFVEAKPSMTATWET